jgi:hypothetical protein
MTIVSPRKTKALPGTPVAKRRSLLHRPGIRHGGVFAFDTALSCLGLNIIPRVPVGPPRSKSALM